MKRRWFSWRRAVGLLLVAAATALAVWLAGPAPFDRLVAWKWRCQIEQADDREALATVGRIAGLGAGGLSELAGLLGSERLGVAEAARQALADELRRWPTLDAPVRRQRQLILAQALADWIDTFSPDARCIASDVALRILGSIPADDTSDAAIVAACDLVLRESAAQRRGRLLVRRPTAAVLDAEQRGSQEFDANRGPRLANLPGGNLLPGNLETSPAEPQLADDAVAAPHDRELATNEPARLPEPAAQGLPDPVESDEELEAAAATLHHHAGPDTGEETEEEAMDEAAAILRWMFALRSSDPARRRRAEQELRAQGFEALQLELARQLTDPDPRVRRDLAESLPSMPGIDARNWLVWLSRDQHADVRLAAMSVMATCGDPNVLRRIEQMARRDTDPRVQRQGEQLLKVLQADTRTTGGGARPVAR